MPAKAPTPPPMDFGKLVARLIVDKVLPRLPAKPTPAIKPTQPIQY